MECELRKYLTNLQTNLTNLQTKAKHCLDTLKLSRDLNKDDIIVDILKDMNDVMSMRVENEKI